MTPDDLASALAFQHDMAQALSAAITRDIVAALTKDTRLDEPDQAFRLRIRSCVDHAVGLLAQALIHAREPQGTATMDDKLADLEGRGDPLASTFAELEGGDPAGEPVADFDRASGTQEAQE